MAVLGIFLTAVCTAPVLLFRLEPHHASSLFKQALQKQIVRHGFQSHDCTAVSTCQNHAHDKWCDETHIALVMQENLHTPKAAEGCWTACDALQTVLGDMTAGSSALWVGALAHAA